MNNTHPKEDDKELFKKYKEVIVNSKDEKCILEAVHRLFEHSLKHSVTNYREIFHVTSFIKDAPKIFANIIKSEKEVEPIILSEFVKSIYRSKNKHTIHNIVQLFKNTYHSNKQMRLDEWSKFFKYLSFKNEVKLERTVMIETDLLLGKGTYANIYLAFIDDFTPIATKKFASKLELNELSILMDLKHDNIIRIYGYITTKNMILLEFIPGGTLQDLLDSKKGHLSEQESREIILQLLNTIKYLSDRNIYHRDLKLDNIMVDPEGKIKLIDFGLSKRLDHDKNYTKTVVGTPNFMAPEIFSQKTHGEYNPLLTDLYSVGIILYDLMSKDLPFSTSDKYATIEQKDRPVFPSYFSESLIDLISRLITAEPNDRITLDQVFEHPWVKGISTHDLLLQKIQLLERDVSNKSETIKMLERSLTSPLQNFLGLLNQLCVQHGQEPKEVTTQEIYTTLSKLLNKK